jgi:hypothetical protein
MVDLAWDGFKSGLDDYPVVDPSRSILERIVSTGRVLCVVFRLNGPLC